MQRYFVLPSQITDRQITITGEDVHHISKVMRFQPGDQVICSDGLGQDVIAIIQSIDKAQVNLEITAKMETNREPKVSVWLAQSIPKADKMDWILQKGTEIGASRFLPFSSERTIVQLDGKKESKRLERWQKIVKEAAEQAHRSVLPEVAGILTWKQLLAVVPDVDIALLAYEAEEGKAMGDIMEQWKRDKGDSFIRESSNRQPIRILVAIGPEGGFSEKEVAAAVSAGFVSVGLGKRILRTETAGMVALTALLYTFGEMGG